MIGCQRQPWAMLLLAAAMGLAYAQDRDKAVAEAEEASREDVLASRRMGDAQVHERLLRGTFHLKSEQQRDNAEVLGFLVTRDRTYHLKVGNERVREELTKRAGQKVSLEGEVRNRGKYFIAHRFAAALPPPVALRNLKGL